MNSLRLAILGFALQGPLAGSAAARSESAQGNLTVTAMVQSSVGVVVDGQGNPRIVVANAAGPGDNVSGLTIISVQASTVVPQKKAVQKRKRNVV